MSVSGVRTRSGVVLRALVQSLDFVLSKEKPLESLGVAGSTSYSSCCRKITLAAVGRVDHEAARGKAEHLGGAHCLN